ncbi:MAG TPA: hypothetical protein PLS20_05770 [Ruminococcus flavefaciens]|nr:hypothetical protein [Ruminococcus flavefaciens]
MKDGKKAFIKKMIQYAVPVLLILIALPSVTNGLFYIFFIFFQAALIVYALKRKEWSEEHQNIEWIYKVVMIFDTILAILMLIVIISLCIMSLTGGNVFPPQH